MDAELDCILGQPLHATPCVVGLLPLQALRLSRHGVWAEAVLRELCLVVSRVRARRRFGTYTVGEANKTFTIRLEASSFPNLEGTVQRGPFMITGDELRVTNPAPKIESTAAPESRRGIL